VPNPTDLANSYSCTYDAWNRLVEIDPGGTTKYVYAYL